MKEGSHRPKFGESMGKVWVRESNTPDRGFNEDDCLTVYTIDARRPTHDRESELPRMRQHYSVCTTWLSQGVKSVEFVTGNSRVCGTS